MGLFFGASWKSQKTKELLLSLMGKTYLGTQKRPLATTTLTMTQKSYFLPFAPNMAGMQAALDSTQEHQTLEKTPAVMVIGLIDYLLFVGLASLLKVGP